MEYEDILLQELMETPGELYDLPEFKQDDKFDVESYINNNDFTWWSYIIFNNEITSIPKKHQSRNLSSFFTK